MSAPADRGAGTVAVGGSTRVWYRSRSRSATITAVPRLRHALRRHSLRRHQRQRPPRRGRALSWRPLRRRGALTWPIWSGWRHRRTLLRHRRPGQAGVRSSPTATSSTTPTSPTATSPTATSSSILLLLSLRLTPSRHHRAVPSRHRRALRPTPRPTIETLGSASSRHRRALRPSPRPTIETLGPTAPFPLRPTNRPSPLHAARERQQRRRLAAFRRIQAWPRGRCVAADDITHEWF